MRLEPSKHHTAEQPGDDVSRSEWSTGRVAVSEQLAYVPYILAATELSSIVLSWSEGHADHRVDSRFLQG